MTKIPVISGQTAIKSFLKSGFTISRRTGWHVISEKAGLDVTLSVPLHDELKRGTLRNLIKDSGLTVKEFVTLI